MTRRLEAIFENGVLRPVTPLEGVAESSRVTVSLEMPDSNNHALSGCIGIMPAEDAEEMMRIIEEEFEQVDPRDWQ
jgi:predicted DNA-binding antitoxin AbrB/MazE fold protein